MKSSRVFPSRLEIHESRASFEPSHHSCGGASLTARHSKSRATVHYTRVQSLWCAARWICVSTVCCCLAFVSLLHLTYMHIVHSWPEIVFLTKSSEAIQNDWLRFRESVRSRNIASSQRFAKSWFWYSSWVLWVINVDYTTTNEDSTSESSNAWMVLLDYLLESFLLARLYG